MSTIQEKVKNEQNVFYIVYNNNISIKNCVLEEILRKYTLKEPKVDIIEKKDGVYYTLIMLDPDAPYGYLDSDETFPNSGTYGCTNSNINISYGCTKNNTDQYGNTLKDSQVKFRCTYKDDPRNQTFLHWWISNIVYENGKLKGAEEWVTYYPPTPPKGKHRYYFYLFEQGCKVTKNDIEINDNNRMPFILDLWKTRYNLKFLHKKGFIVASPELE